MKEWRSYSPFKMFAYRFLNLVTSDWEGNFKSFLNGFNINADYRCTFLNSDNDVKR